MYKYQLEAADTTNYLGIDVSYNLSWNHHIDRTVKKENIMIGFLTRNLKISNQDTKSAAYFSLVRPYLEYCASIWNPYSIQSIRKLEMVQRRAARYATNRYRNTSSMLDNLEWETVEPRRTTIQLVMFFQDHQRPSGYSILQLPHTSQQQDEIQPLKEDAAVPYKIRCFQVQFLS